MGKWLTKDGLKAIFTDAVMAPVNLAKEQYRCGEGAFGKGHGISLATSGQVPGLLLGALLLSNAGIIAGVAGLLIANNAMLGYGKIMDIAETKDLWPKIAAHAETLKP